MEAILDFFSLYQGQLLLVLLAIIAVVVIINVIMVLRMIMLKRKNKNLYSKIDDKEQIPQKTKKKSKEKKAKKIKKSKLEQQNISEDNIVNEDYKYRPNNIQKTIKNNQDPYLENKLESENRNSRDYKNNYLQKEEEKEGYVEEYLDEKEANRLIGNSISGVELTVGRSVEGDALIRSDYNGILSINKNNINRINEIKPVVISTLKDNSIVKKGEVVGKVGILSTLIKKSDLSRVKRIENSTGKSIKILNFKSLRCATVNLNQSSNSEIDRNILRIEDKINEFGGNLTEMRRSIEDKESIKSEIDYLIKKGQNLIIITGGISSINNIAAMSIEEINGEIIAYKLPTFPKTMLTLGYKSDVPILVIPSILDIYDGESFNSVLAKIFIKEKVTAKDITELSDGMLS